MTKQPAPTASPQSRATLHTLLNFSISQTTINVGVVDRLASLVVGALVVLLIVRRFLLYTGLAVIGGYLLYRGLTGYCPLYASEQIDTRHWRMKLLDFQKELALFPIKGIWQQRFADNEQRSKDYEQDNSTRQMATHARQPENGVGPADGE